MMPTMNYVYQVTIPFLLARDLLLLSIEYCEYQLRVNAYRSNQFYSMNQTTGVIKIVTEQRWANNVLVPFERTSQFMSHHILYFSSTTQLISG